MALPAPLDPRVGRLLKLGRSDRRAAAAEIGKLSTDEQVALVRDAPVRRREELLDLAPSPELVIPRLPEAELCFTVREVGLADAAWILEYATDEQLVTALDLDAWNDLTPDRPRLAEWFEALAEAGRETVLRAARAVDAELLCLMLKERIHVLMKPNDDPGWSAPPGWKTLEGQYYFTARHPDDDLEWMTELLSALFDSDYWLYFRMMQAVMSELDAETEEWALRWRTGRLQDLGFPAWDEAMRIYTYQRPADRAAIPEGEKSPLDVGTWSLPVWMPDLPAEPESPYLLFRAAARLGDEERSGLFYAFVSLVNKVAVADRLPLADAASIPEATRKAAGTTSRGLEHVSTQNSLDPTDVLRRVTLERLFRTGANLET